MCGYYLGPIHPSGRWFRIVSMRPMGRSLVCAASSVVSMICMALVLSAQNPSVQEALARGDEAKTAGALAKASDAYKAAEDRARSLGDRLGTALALQKQAELQQSQDKLPAAIETMRKSLEIFEAINDRPAIAGALNRISYFFYLQGNLAQSKHWGERAFAVRKELGDENGIASSLNNLGDLARRMGELDRALEYLQGAVAAYTRLGDGRFRALATGNLALTYLYLGDSSRALSLCKEALDVARSINNDASVALALSRLGEIYRNQGRHGLELDSYQRCLELRRRIGDKWTIAVTLHNVGLAHQSLRNYDQAERLYRESQAINREVGNMGLVSSALQNLAEIAVERGRPLDALRGLEESIAIARGNQLEVEDILLAMGNTLRKLQRFDEAASYLRQVLDRSHKPAAAVALMTLASIEYDRRRYADAAQTALQAIELSRTIEAPDVEWYALTIRGRALLASQQAVAASQEFDRAIEVIEKLRALAGGDELERQRFFSDKLDPYFESVTLAIRAGHTEKALQYAERSKARVLFDALKSGRSLAMDRLPPDDRRREQELRTKLVILNDRIRKDAAASVALESQRTAARFEYEAFRAAKLGGVAIPGAGSGADVTVEIARKLAGSSGVVLEYVTMAGRTLVFAITGATARCYWLPYPSARLQAMSREFRERIASRDLRAAESARALYEALIGPAAVHLAKKQELIVIPDGFLWDVPFHAIQPRDGKWLIEEMAVAYAPSLAVLAAARPGAERRRTAAPTLLAFGNPTSSLPPLPDGEEQVKRIAALYGPSRSSVHLGAAAQETAFKAEAGRYSVVHVAAHGILSEENGMYSHLALSNAAKTGQDGLLEAWEIMSLKLRNDLVVLSACETARGTVSQGEGMIGLAWAFQVAGSPSLIVSQWKVESASAMELMVGFHRNWIASGYRSKASALREAMLEVLRKPEFSHPFYWASHVLVGRSE